MTEVLPPEAWLRVLLFLDVESVERVAQVSHDCRLLATDPHLWRLLALRILGLGRGRDSAACLTNEEVNLHPEDEGGGWRRTVLSWRALPHRRLRFCFLGHVDCGKSTLIGRLLVSSGMVSKAAFERITRLTWEYGNGFYAHAWVTDRIKDERERGITLDYHIRTCKLTNGRTVEFIDTPGHRCYGIHAAEGLMLADVAVVVVNALPGDYQNGKQDVAAHIRTARKANVRRLVVAVNKNDSYHSMPHPSFEEIKADMLKQAMAAGFREQEVAVLRLSGKADKNVTTRTELPYQGYCGPALIELMEQITEEADPFSDSLASSPSTSLIHSMMAKRPPYGPTRLSVLRRYNRRSRVAVACGLQAHEHLIAVVVQSGIVRAGQTLHVTAFTTDAAAATVFTVVGIQIHQSPVTKAVAGEIAALRLAMTPPAAAGEVRPDCSGPAARRRRHAVSRGVVLAGKPIAPVASFTVHLKLAAHSPVLRCGHVPFCLIHSASLPCRVEKVLVQWDQHGKEVECLVENGKRGVAHEGCRARVILKPMGDVYVEPYSHNPALGTVLVVHSDHRVVAVGRVETVQYGLV